MRNVNQKKQKKQPQRQNFDYVLLTVVLFLLGFGLLMIYSASSYEASVTYGTSIYFLKKQGIAMIFGLAGLFVFSKIPYPLWRKVSFMALIASLGIVCLVKTGLGMTLNGASRWIKLGPFSFQPAELVKVTIIIFQANLLSKMGKGIQTFRGVVLYFVAPTVSCLMIYFITKNLSSAIIVFGIAVAMLFVAIPTYKWFVGLGLAGSAAVAGLVYYVITADASGSYRFNRIKAWINPEAYSTDSAFQTLQALYAIGSGGIWGKGLGQSMQKRRFLPEAQNDMIFSIICEELGLFGAIAVIAMFIVLIWCCMVIANNTIDQFGSLLVVGVMAHYAIQVILNIAVVTNTIPNTGITLPFISYGGTAVCFLLAEIGIVLNVSQRAKVVT